MTWFLFVKHPVANIPWIFKTTLYELKNPATRPDILSYIQILQFWWFRELFYLVIEFLLETFHANRIYEEKTFTINHIARICNEGLTGKGLVLERKCMSERGGNILLRNTYYHFDNYLEGCFNMNSPYTRQ